MKHVARTGSIITLLVLLATAQAAEQPAMDWQSVGPGNPDAFAFSPTPDWVLDAPALPAGIESEPQVLRLKDTQHRVDVKHVTYHRIALQVNDPAMLQSIGQVSIPFVPDYQKLRLHTLRLLRGGDVIDQSAAAKIRFLQREERLETGMYDGVVTAAIVIEDVRVGDTLELAYSIQGRNPVFEGWFFDLTPWRPVATVSFEYRRVVLNRPADRPVRYLVLGPDPASVPEPQEIDLGDRVAVVFEASSIPRQQLDPFVPAGYIPLNQIQFSEFDSWSTVADWAGRLFEPPAEAAALPWERIDSFRTLPSDERRVAAALRYVQEEIRYLAESFGESSHRPAQPAEVASRRYGDCKDKTLLLVTILKELGIAADPVLVIPGKTGEKSTWLPSPSLFDHAIVRAFVENRWYYLDPTRLGQAGSLERLGQVFDGCEVLVVTRNTDRLTRIPDGDPGAVLRSEIVERVTISDFAQPLVLEVRRTHYGWIAEAIRLALRQVPYQEIERSLLAEFTQRYPTARVADPPTIEDDTTLNALTIVESYVVPDLAINRGDSWRIDYTPTGLGLEFLIAPSPDRSSPLGLPFPLDWTYALEVRFPTEYSQFSDPTTHVLQNEFFEFRISRRFRGNVARHEYRLKTLARMVPVTALEEYGNAVRELNDIDMPDLGVSKAVTSDGQTEGLTPENRVYRTIRDANESDIDWCTRTIRSGRVSGAKLASVLRVRANSYAMLGLHRRALRDANKATRLDGDDPGGYFVRASILFLMGEYERSVADYTRALEVGGDPAVVYYRRGQSYFYAGRMEQALSDFSDAITADGDPDSRAFRMLWYVWTARHLKEPLPASFREEIAEIVSGAWPRPALGLFTGDVEPDEIERLAEDRNPQERILMLCEAYFYIGQYHLVRGDVDAAAHYFRRSRATRALGMTEFEAAQRELQRLGLAE